MDSTKLQEKLIAAARRHPPADQVPYAFEKRIMAHLSQPLVDVWRVWSHALWRGAISCVIVAFLMIGWSKVSSPSENLSDAFESTILAAADHFDEDLQ